MKAHGLERERKNGALAWFLAKRTSKVLNV